MNKFLKIGAIVAMSMSFASGSVQAATNFVINGSFEDNVLNKSWDVFQTVTPWYTIDGAGIELQQNSTIGGADAQDGNFYVELDSHGTDSNTRMGQDIALTTGNYVLTFYYQPRTNNLNDNGVIFGIAETDFSPIIASSTVDSTSGAQPGWAEVSMNFAIASDQNYTLYFEADGKENTLGGFIDNVSISAIPEPATWLMMIMGFGMVGMATRRRKTMVLS